MNAQSTIIVISSQDGKKFKMVMKGDLNKLTVKKLKKYLVASTGTPLEEQVLHMDGNLLLDDQTGREIGLHDNSTLMLSRKPAGFGSRIPNSQFPLRGSPRRTMMDIETLDAQREMIERERRRREEEYGRQSDAYSQSVFTAEQQRRLLEADIADRDAKLRKIVEDEERAMREKARLEDARRQEYDREALRVKDLEERRKQLEIERERIRAVELQKLEVDRKQQLLQNTRRDFHTERERLEREKLEFEDRLRRQELEIREKELAIERERLETERKARQIENEKALLHQQKRLEEDMLKKERSIEELKMYDLTAATKHASVSSRVIPYAFDQTIPVDPIIKEKELELERLRAERLAGPRHSPVPSHVSQRIEREDVRPFHNPTVLTTPFPHATPPPAPVPEKLRELSRFEPGPTPLGAASADSLRLAEDNLREFAHDLGVDGLKFDENNTCVVSVEDKYTLLITFDPTTERLYLYSTLLTSLPKNTSIRLKLYEFLLEGALLGRDMAGGGVGVSVKNDFVLMSTSVFLPKSYTGSLKALAPVFVESIVKWRQKVKDILESGGMDATHLFNDPNSAPGTPRGGTPTNSTESPYPSLGIEITDGITTEGVFTKFPDGVAVVSVRGPASTSGIAPNDIIQSVNGQRVRSLSDFNNVIARLIPHSTAQFVVRRGDRVLSFDVRVGASQLRPGGKFKNVMKKDGSNRTESPREVRSNA